MKLNKIGRILKIILLIGYIIAIPILGYLPFILKNNISLASSMFIIYPNGILMLGVIYNFIKIFNLLEVNKPFSKEVTKCFKTTSIITLVMSIFWIIDLLFMVIVLKNHYINYIIVLIFLAVLFFGVSIALYLLKELFNQAIEYKEENDLTI